MQASLARHLSNRHHLPVVRWMEVGAGGQFLASWFDPTIRQPVFDLSSHQWTLLNRFRTKQGNCESCQKSGALQQPTFALVANAKRCHILSTAAHRPSWRVGCSDCTQLICCHWMVGDTQLINALDNYNSLSVCPCSQRKTPWDGKLWTSLHTDNHANTPPLGFGCPSCRLTNSVKALKALQ